MVADKTGFYYHTGMLKPVCRQLKKNPKVELCIYKPGDNVGTMMRVTGDVELIEDEALEERLYKDRPWVKDPMKTAPEDSRLAMFRVAHGEAYFWTMANNLREGDAPRIEF